MARLHGKGGSITWATGYSAHVFAWSCERTSELADGTELGNVNRVRDDGLGDASGSFQCYVDDTTSITDKGSRGTGTFKFSATKTITAKLVIEGFSTQVNLDGNIQVTYTWKLGGDGAATDFVIA